MLRENVTQEVKYFAIDEGWEFIELLDNFSIFSTELEDGVYKVEIVNLDNHEIVEFEINEMYHDIMEILEFIKILSRYNQQSIFMEILKK